MITLKKSDKIFIKNRGGGVLVFLAIAATLYVCALLSIDLHHDGYMLSAAVKVSRGGKLYRDIYFQYGPVSVVLHVVFIKILGESILSLRLCAVVFYFIAWIMIYKILQFFMPKISIYSMMLAWFLCSCFLQKELLPWPSVYALTFTLVMAYCILKYIETESRIMWWISGACTGLAIFTKWSVGIIFFIAALLCIFFMWYSGLIKKERAIYSLISYSLSTVIVSAVCIAVLLYSGTFNDFWQQTVNNIIGWGKSAGFYQGGSDLIDKFLNGIKSPFVRLIIRLLLCLFPFAMTKNIGWGILPIVLITTGMVTLIKAHTLRKKDVSNRRDNLNLLILSILAGASWSQYYPAPGVEHFFYSGFLMFCVWSIVAYYISKILAPGKNKYIITVIMIIVTLGLWQGVFKSNLIGEKDKINGFMKRVKILDTKCDIFSFPYMNGIYLEKNQNYFHKELASCLYEFSQIYPEKRIYNYTEKLHLLSLYEDEGNYPKVGTEIEDFLINEDLIVLCNQENKVKLIDMGYQVQVEIPIKYDSSSATEGYVTSVVILVRV